MSLINCTSDCVYQENGICCLERAASFGEPSASNTCVHYVPRRKPGGVKAESGKTT